MCKRSVSLMEVAFALQVVTIGMTEVPEGARKNRFFERIHRRLMSPAWLAAARAALGDEGLGRVAACFRAGCLEYATPKMAAFYEDEEQLYYLFEENMRVLGDMILDLVRLPDMDVDPQQAPAMRAQAVQAPPVARVPEPVPNAAASAKVANAPPSKPSSVDSSIPADNPGPKPRHVDIIRPPALRFVPARATTRRPMRAPLTRERQRRLPARPRHRIRHVDTYAMEPPQPRSRSPPESTPLVGQRPPRIQSWALEDRRAPAAQRRGRRDHE